MKTKIIASAVACLFLTTPTLLVAFDKNIAYDNGVKDALNITNKAFSNIFLKKTKMLNGFITYKDATLMNEIEIIKVSSLAEKMGCDVGYYKLDGKDIILFAEQIRKPDMMALAEKFKTFDVIVSVISVNEKVEAINLIGAKTIQKLNSDVQSKKAKQDERLEYLENYVIEISKGNKQANIALNKNNISNTKNCPKTQVQTINLSSVQVVNRVVTQAYLDRNHKTINTIDTFNEETKKEITQKLSDSKNKEVAKNLKLTQNNPLPDLNNFSKAYTYLLQNATITNDNHLVLNGSLYSAGDIIGSKWKINEISLKKGIVVLDDRTVTLKSK